MKAALLLLVIASPQLFAGPIETSKPIKNPPPPVFSAPGAAPTGAPQGQPAIAPGTTAFSYQQGVTASRPPLVSPEQARAILDRFKAGYPKLGAPRMLIYVNRDLVDDASGLQLAGRTEKVETLKTDLTPTGNASSAPLGQNVTVVGNASVDAAHSALRGSSEKVTAENNYRHRDRTNAPLADKQTIRDVERLMGRPLRLGGARLADQRVATQLLADRPVQEFLSTSGTPQAAKDREALLRSADVVVEVLISSKSLSVPGVSGDAVYQVPDMQATAIRLADAQILGQASSADILGPERLAGRVVRNHDVREITEAVALALMEDMMQAVP